MDASRNSTAGTPSRAGAAAGCSGAGRAPSTFNTLSTRAAQASALLERMMVLASLISSTEIWVMYPSRATSWPWVMAPPSTRQAPCWIRATAARFSST